MASKLRDNRTCFSQLKVVFVLLLGLLALAETALAHPAVGIVRDSRGNVFYTDLVHVWVISPAGKKSIAVKNVHTHALYLDTRDNLFGEDVRYEGEATNRYHHRVWKRSPDGKQTDVIKEKPGFPDAYGLVRDGKGNQLWISYQPGKSFIRKRDAASKITTISPDKPLGHLSWLAVSPDGKILYVTSGTGLHKLTAGGKVTTLLTTTKEENQGLMGIWLERDGSVYVAAYGQKAIKKVEKSGAVTMVLRSKAPWAPSALCIAPDKTFWILEYSASNEARVRSIDARGRERIF